MKTIHKFICLLLLAVISTGTIVAQDSREYAYTTDKLGDLRKDANGNAIDFSTVTSIIAEGSVNTNSAIQNLPFQVLFMGKVYKSFLVATGGHMVLGNTDLPAEPFNWPLFNNGFKVGATYKSQGVIAPFWDFQIAKSIKYTTVGTAPNRTLVVEWVTTIPNAATPKPGYQSNYQVRIYETTGVIEMVYGQMIVPTGNTTVVSATIGIGKNGGLADYNFITLDNIDSLKPIRTLAAYTTAQDALYNKADTGLIKQLSYDNDSTAIRLVFVPVTINAPTDLQSISVGFEEIVLYWDDNSNAESYFEIQLVDRLGNFKSLDTTTAGINFYVLDSLELGTNYTFRVRAVGQGKFSTFSNTFSVSTNAPQPLEAIKSGNWSDTSTWSTNAIPTRFDSVYVSKGFQITMDANDGAAYHLVVDSATLEFENTAMQHKLSAYGSLWIGKNGKVAVPVAPSANNTTNNLAVKGSVYNKGILDLYKNDSNYEMGAKLSFFGSNISFFTSDSGTVNDFYTIASERVKITDSVYFSPTSMTVREYNTDSLSGAGFVDHTSWVGTLVFDGNYKLQTRFFTSPTFTVGVNAGLWLNNDSINIVPQNGNITWNGAMHISKGIMGFGSASNNYFNGAFQFILDDGEVNFAGAFSSSNFVSFIQNGGIIRASRLANNSGQNAFYLANANGIIKMLGGEIVLTQPGLSGWDFYTYTTNTNSVYGNTWVKLTEAASPNYVNRNFVVFGYIPNLMLDTAANGPRVIKMSMGGSQGATIYGKMVISTNDTVTITCTNINFAGDSLIVNGLLYNTNVCSGSWGYLAMTGKGNQVITGTNRIILNGAFHLFQADNNSTVTLGSDSILTNVIFNGGASLNLTQGKLINANYMVVGNGSALPITVEVGRGSGVPRYTGAEMDTFPKFNMGTSTYTLQYTNLGKTFATGYELPASGKVNFLSINSDTAVRFTRPIDVSQTLTLTKGVFITDSINKIRVTNTAIAGISGGSTTAFVLGPLTRKIAPNQSNVTYSFPVGGNVYNPFSLLNLNTNTNTAEVTAEFKNDSLVFTPGNNFTSADNSFGYWRIKADSNASAITNYNVSFTYKLSDGFARLGGGKTTNNSDVPTIDSIGSMASLITTNIISNNLTFDSANSIQYFVPGEYLGDTVYGKTYKVGVGEDFENLTAVAKKLSGSFIAGSPQFLITATYQDVNEVYPIIFPQLRYTGEAKKILIRLDNNVFGVVTGNKTKTLNASYGMIALNGGDSIEFDGAGYDILGNPTNTREWTFKTETNTAAASVFMYQQDARYNTLSNLNITANTTSVSQGAVFYASTFAGGKGNDNNTVKNCFLLGIASNGIYSLGLSAASTNDSISILNNELSTFTTAAISASTNSGSGWKISGNHIMSNPILTTVNVGFAINVNAINTAAGYEITNNYIGGNEKFALGSLGWQANNTLTSTLINLGTTFTSPSVFKGNVIRNYKKTVAATTVTRCLSVAGGKWIISGNKFGGSAPGVNEIQFGANVATPIIYVIGTTNTGAEITDNDISYINLTFSGQLNNKSFRAIDYNAPTPAYIARNTIHDITNMSFANSVTNPAGVGIFLNTSSGGNIIENNEISGFNINTANQAATVAGITVNAGNGEIRNNKVSNLNYSSGTATAVSTLIGINVQAGIWNVYNNQISVTNSLYPNNIMEMNGIRWSTTSTGSKVHHNSIWVSGQTRNSNSYAFASQGTITRAELYNNILVCKTNISGGAFYPIAANINTSSAILNSDFNLYYTPYSFTPLRSSATTILMSLDSFKTAFGFNKNSLTGFIPKFRDTINNNLLLVNDTFNWKLNAAGGATTYLTDFETEVRNNANPDIGADEFVAPMYTAPLFLGGNDTLCAGEIRTLKVQNPNTNGNIYWFNQPAGGDTLFVGDTYNTDSVKVNTTYYAQVSDTLLRSYRTAIVVRVNPVVSASISNLPYDSICNGTSITLVADSISGLTINWYDSLTAPTPFFSGRKYTTPALTDTVSYYLSTTNKGCVSTRNKFLVLVSDTTISTPAIAPQTVCANTAVNWTTNGPDQIRWYTDELSTDVEHEDTTFTTNNLMANTTFWYEATNGRCTGPRLSVSVTVNPIPLSPVIDSLFTICNNTGITLSPMATGTVNWYKDTAAATLPFANGPLVFTGLTNDTTVYTNQTQAGCASPQMVKTTVKVQTPATVSIVSAPSVICYNTNAQIALGKTGVGTISWYAQNAGGTAIATGDTFNTPILTNNKTYYYQLFDGLCATTRDSVIIFVDPFPAKPVIAKADSVCFGTIDTLTATAAGATINWYESKTAAPVATGNDFILPAIKGTKKYFAKAIYSGCESVFEEVTVIVDALPQPPLVDSVSPVCRNKAAVLKATSPVITEWYNNPFATTPVFSGNTYNTANLAVNTTFYVQAFDGKCRSEKRPVVVSLRNAPTAPLVNTINPFCWGDNATVTASSNSLVRWYKTAADSVHFRADSLMFIGKLYKDTTYFIESYDGFCTSAKVPYNVDVIRYMDGFSFSIPDSANLGTPMVLSAQGNIDNLYGWNFGANANISSGTGTGPYNISWAAKGLKNVRLTVTKKTGNVTCDTVFTKQVKVYSLSELLSADELSANSFVSVYPNPASSLLNIMAQGENTLVSVSLYDVTGKQLLNEPVRSHQLTVNVEGFAKGIYLLRITLENNQTVLQKVIVE